MKTKDQIELEVMLKEKEKKRTEQEIALICMTCGIQKPTGNFTTKVDYESRYAYSHGYCSIPCAAKQYPGIEELFTEYQMETCKW